MSDRKLSVSFKGGQGFEAPLFSLGGDSVEELNFQMEQVLLQGSLEKATALALRFQNEYRDGRHATGAQPQQQQGPPQGQQQAQNQWANQPPPQQDPWANQQQGPPQGQHQGYYGGQPQSQGQPQGQPQGGGAPNGAPVCKCGQAMEYKTTNGGKPVWRCRDWRWNNGNPTPNHDQIWVEGNH